MALGRGLAAVARQMERAVALHPGLRSRWLEDLRHGSLAALLERAFLTANADIRPAQIEAAVAPAYMAPTLVALLFAPQPSAKIPLWEQQMSVGAVGMNLLHSAHAHGFVASWITGWTTYNPTVREALCQGDEQIAGFFFIGTPGQPLDERPRPDPPSIIRHWP